MPVNTFWGSERINHPASVHAWYRGPTGFNGSQCVEEWFSRYFFPLRERVFWVFTFILSCIISSCVRGFVGFYFLCFEILLYIFSVLPLRGLGFLKESELC